MLQTVNYDVLFMKGEKDTFLFKVKRTKETFRACFKNELQLVQENLFSIKFPDNHAGKNRF